VQHESHTFCLTNRVALVTTLGLALLGTPAVAFGVENSVPTTAGTASVLEPAQSQADESTARPVASQATDSEATDETTPKDAPQEPAVSGADESSAAPDAANEIDTASEQQPKAENTASSQQPKVQNEETPEVGQTKEIPAATQTETTAVSSDAAESSSHAEAVETSDSTPAAAPEDSASTAATTSSLAPAKESLSSVPMYRLYNRYNGEHLFTTSASEAQNLVSVGWSGESVAWFTPSSGNAVYRLYNPYSGDHHYTTDKSEYDYLGSIGWRKEGEKFYSDGSRATPVFRLFNPYVTIATHHYTTSQSEYNYLGTIGWKQEGKGWYGVAMPADGWYVSPTGEELYIQGGVVKSDAVVTNESGQERYITSAGFVAKGSRWTSPSSGIIYVTADDGAITQKFNPQAGLEYCWLKSSPYWSGAGVVKELLMNVHYSKGRYGASISKIVIHHNMGNLTTETCYATWQTRAASAHYQVEANGTVGQLVLDSDTAWQAGDWQINTRSIGIEHADYIDASGQWRMTEATINSGARLVAALCLEYSLGRPQWGVNVVGHNECTSTECPASLAIGGSQHNEYLAKAQEWYDKLSRI
jgi:outer membrane biosynthesis protein TonB